MFMSAPVGRAGAVDTCTCCCAAAVMLLLQTAWGVVGPWMALRAHKRVQIQQVKALCAACIAISPAQGGPTGSPCTFLPGLSWVLHCGTQRTIM